MNKRLHEAITTASYLSHNIVIVALEEEDLFFNLSFAVEKTGKSYPPITPQTFSFNAKEGMCLECQGLGYIYGSELQTNTEILSLRTIDLLFTIFEKSSFLKNFLSSFFTHFSIDPYKKICDLSYEKQSFLFHGDLSKKFYVKKEKTYFSWQGLCPILAKAAKHGTFPYNYLLRPYMQQRLCPHCYGTRLNPLARHVFIKDKNIVDLCHLSIDHIKTFLLSLSYDDKPFLEESFTQLLQQLSFLQEIGLGYLSLDRSAPTLSGGEMTRVRAS